MFLKIIDFKLLMVLVRDELKIGDKVTIDSSDNNENGNIEGEVVDKIIVFMVQDSDGEDHAYGDSNWMIGEIKDLDNISKK